LFQLEREISESSKRLFFMQMIEVLLLVSNFFSLSLVLGVVTNKDVAAAMENILVLGIQLYGFISLSPCATARALYHLPPRDSSIYLLFTFLIGIHHSHN